VRRRCRVLALEEGRGAVYTHWEVVVSETGFVSPRVVVGRHVPEASQKIVDVVAVPSSILTDTRTEAEFGIGDERGPFVVLEVVSKRVSKYQSTNGVTVTVGTVGIEFTTRITLGDVNFGKVTHTSHLDIIGRLDEMDTLQGSIRNRPGSPTRFSAPSYFLALSVPDGTDTRRSPKTEIVDIIDPRGLAIRTLTRSGTTVVRTSLAVLGLVWECRGRVADIPDLIRVPASAGPDLDLGSVGRGATSKVSAFAMVGPGKMIIGGIIPLLVLIPTRSVASIDLEFGPVGVYAVSYIQTH